MQGGAISAEPLKLFWLEAESPLRRGRKVKGTPHDYSKKTTKYLTMSDASLLATATGPRASKQEGV